MIQVDLHASNRSYYIVYFISFHTSKGFGHLQAPNITTRTKKKTYLGSGNPSSQNDWLRRALVYFGHILDTPIRIGVSNDRITHFRPSMTRSFNDSFLNPSIVLQPHSPDMIVLLLDLNLETSKLFRFFVDWPGGGCCGCPMGGCPSMPGCPMGCGCRVVISREFWVMSDGSLKACLGGCIPQVINTLLLGKKGWKAKTPAVFCNE